MAFAHGLTAHWPRNAIWQETEKCLKYAPPPAPQSSVKGMAVLWPVAPDLLHLLYAVWKHLCETSGSECYLARRIAQGAQWYCSLGSFITDLALCPAQLDQACVHSQTLSLDYHQRSCWPHPTSMCPRTGCALWKKAIGKRVVGVSVLPSSMRQSRRSVVCLAPARTMVKLKRLWPNPQNERFLHSLKNPQPNREFSCLMLVMMLGF